MNKKVEIGLAVGVIVLLVVVVLAILLRQQVKSTTSPVSSPTASLPTSADGTAAPTTSETPAPAPVVAGAETTAMIFVERFASYSSESNFANITDVLPLTTAALSTRLQTITAEQKAAAPGSAYYGISTKVISQKVQEQTETTTTLLVSTQRAESIGSPGNTTIRYQDITVKLVKVGDSWKVDDFTWGK